jgi:hypothetical protein
MAVRWEHKTALVSARDRAEQLLRSMPREKLAALHARLNEKSLHTPAKYRLIADTLPENRADSG